MNRQQKIEFLRRLRAGQRNVSAASLAHKVYFQWGDQITERETGTVYSQEEFDRLEHHGRTLIVFEDHSGPNRQ